MIHRYACGCVERYLLDQPSLSQGAYGVFGVPASITNFAEDDDTLVEVTVEFCERHATERGERHDGAA